MTGSRDAGRSYWARNAARYDRSMVLLGGPMRLVRERVAAALVGVGDVLEIGAGPVWSRWPWLGWPGGSWRPTTHPRWSNAWSSGSWQNG